MKKSISLISIVAVIYLFGCNHAAKQNQNHSAADHVHELSDSTSTHEGEDATHTHESEEATHSHGSVGTTLSHEGEFNPRRARIRVLIREKEGINAPLICNQCKTCLNVCKRDALFWDEELGVVRVDAEKCNACGLCIKACPQAAIMLDPVSGIVNICDLCNGDPQCVKWCPENVLTYEA